MTRRINLPKSSKSSAVIGRDFFSVTNMAVDKANVLSDFRTEVDLEDGRAYEVASGKKSIAKIEYISAKHSFSFED